MSLFTDIKTLIDEPSTGVFWSDQQVYDAANAAQIQFWADTRFTTSTATLTATASADLVDIPSTIMIPQYYTGTAGRYYNTTHVQLENWNRAWKLEGLGYPKHVVLWDESHLRWFPRPDATYEYILYGVGWPTEIESGNLDVSLPYTGKKALASAAASLLLEATLPDLSDLLKKESDYNKNKFMVSLDNQQSHNTKRIRPGTMFTTAQGGRINVGRRFT